MKARRIRRDMAGTAVIEYMLVLLVLLPIVGLLAMVSWPERLNAANAAAYEAAKAMVEAPDAAAGADLGRARAIEVITNHGYDAGDVDVTFSAATLERGDAMTATVTITLPAIDFPGAGSWAEVRWSKSHTEMVADYRGL